MFADERSDFLAYLKLWTFLEDKRRHLTRRKFERLCRQHFLSPTRVREWHDVQVQLRVQMHELGYRDNEQEADYATAAPCAADRSAQPHRHAHPGRQARLPGRAQPPLLHLSGFRPVREAAQMGDGRRTGRDHQAVRARRRRDRARVGRAAGRPPGQAQLLVAALAGAQGAGGRRREGHAVRPADRAAAQGQLRADRPGRRRARSSSATA